MSVAKRRAALHAAYRRRLFGTEAGLLQKLAEVVVGVGAAEGEEGVARRLAMRSSSSSTCT